MMGDMASLSDFAVKLPEVSATVIGGQLHGLTIDLSESGCKVFRELDGVYRFQNYMRLTHGGSNFFPGKIFPT